MGGMGNWVLPNRYSVSAWNDEKFLETDNGNGFTTLYIYLTPMNYTLENG